MNLSTIFLAGLWILIATSYGRANLKINFNYVDQSSNAIVRDSDATDVYSNKIPSTAIGTYTASSSESETSASTGDTASASETFGSNLSETNEGFLYSFSGTTSASMDNVSTAINQATAGVSPLEIYFTPDEDEMFSATMNLIESPVVGVAGNSKGSFELEDETTKVYLFDGAGTSFSTQLTAGDEYEYEAFAFSSMSNFVPGDPNGLQSGFSSSSQSYAFSLQISPAPEPSSLLLSAIGIITLIMFSRRKAHSVRN